MQCSIADVKDIIKQDSDQLGPTSPGTFFFYSRPILEFGVLG